MNKNIQRIQSSTNVEEACGLACIKLYFATLCWRHGINLLALLKSRNNHLPQIIASVFGLGQKNENSTQGNTDIRQTKTDDYCVI